MGKLQFLAPGRANRGFVTKSWKGRLRPGIGLVGLLWAPPWAVVAQNAPPQEPRSSAVIEYTANESGGRIRFTDPGADSTAVESIRLQLLEAAAACRRGDYRNVRVIRTDLPAIKVLAARPTKVRCTFKPATKGGELVLLGEDNEAVAAIHQLLAATPPPAVRL